MVSIARDSSPDNIFRKLAGVFYSESETVVVKGIHMMHGMVGDAYTGAKVAIRMIASHHQFSIMDMTNIEQCDLEDHTIQQVVDHILSAPPRCVILVNIASDRDRMYKVMSRFARTELKLRKRSCSVRHETTQACMLESLVYAFQAPSMTGLPCCCSGPP